MNGAQAMIKCLEAEGISKVFGYPGVAIAPFYESLYHSDIEHILVRQEQNAGHAASGYARMSRRPAVCVVTSGPGATNLITALATAYADSIPIVAISGQVSSKLLGHDVFQEADMRGATKSFVKHSYLVKNPDDIPRVFKEAFYIASTGRKGPVLIDVPMDVQKSELKKEFAYPEGVFIRGYKPEIKLNTVQLRRVVQALNQAKRPLLCTGGGAILGNSETVIRDFCEKFNYPVVHTMMGMGIMPKKHPLNFGMLGSNGKPYANKAVSKADLLIVAGARIADRAITKPDRLAGQVQIIHIDIDTAEIGKNIGPTIPLVGDLSEIFSYLYDQDIHTVSQSWIDELENIKRSTVDTRVFSDRLVDPNLLVQKLSGKMADDAVYVADVGQNQLWSADNYIMKDGRFVTTGGMGTMGYSIPAAIGAKLVSPEKQVVAVTGDGAFQMSMNELATLKDTGTDVKVVIVRNGFLGLVREYQYNLYDSHYIGVKLSDMPDYSKIAEAYGMPFFSCSSNDELDGTLDAFLSCPEACLMVCDVDGDNRVK